MKPFGSLASMLGLLLLSFAVSGFISKRLQHQPRQAVKEDMLVALPLVPQLLLSGGDRYLAANMGTWRSLIAVPERMTKQQFAVQGELQKSVAWLNPRNEDNYWVAAAILPWNGQHQAAQRVLRAASDSRPYDWQPQFYYAFGLYYFERNPEAAANWLRSAAERLSDQEEYYMLQNLAAAWYVRKFSAADAANHLEQMAARSRSRGFTAYLMRLVERLRALVEMQRAATRFATKFGRSPRDIDELVTSGIVSSLPKDPFGRGFGIDAKGEIQFRENVR